MVEYGRLRCLRTADLERDHPLPTRHRRAHRRSECLGPSQTFDEQRNRSNTLIGCDEREIVRDVAYRFIAHRNDVADSQVARILAQRHCDRAALRNDGERSGGDPWKIGHPERGLRPHVDEPHVVGAAKCHRVLRGGGAYLALKRLAFRADIRVTTGVDAEGAHAALSRLRDQSRPGRGGNREKGGIDLLGEIRQGGVAT